LKKKSNRIDSLLVRSQAKRCRRFKRNIGNHMLFSDVIVGAEL